MPWGDGYFRLSVSFLGEVEPSPEDPRHSERGRSLFRWLIGRSAESAMSGWPLSWGGLSRQEWADVKLRRPTGQTVGGSGGASTRGCPGVANVEPGKVLLSIGISHIKGENPACQMGGILNFSRQSNFGSISREKCSERCTTGRQVRRRMNYVQGSAL